MGIFRTKLDFSDNRQAKQRIITTTNLSGATTFGLPYSDLPTGPNPVLSSITQTIFNIDSTFSGNNTTTIFTWGDSNMSIADSVFSAITPSNSADTQSSGSFYVPDVSSYFNVDGNTGYTHYTGVSYSVDVVDIFDLGGGNYSGELFTVSVDYLDATGLDFTGRTIWVDVSGITRTDRLIIKDKAQVGYVWTCIDSEGKGEWLVSSGSSSGSTYSLWSDGQGLYSAILNVNQNNSLAGGVGAISQGYYTESNGDYSLAGGTYTIANGLNSFVYSHDSNIDSSSSYSTILGGELNNITTTFFSSILGGQNNTINCDNNYGWGSIIGGDNNTVTGKTNYFSIIGGGGNNIYDSNSSIITSLNSTISKNMDYSSIIGGVNHVMTSDFYTGEANTIMLGGGGSTYYNTSNAGFNNSIMIGGSEMNMIGGNTYNTMITNFQSNMFGLTSLSTMIGSDNCTTNNINASTIIGGEQSTIESGYQCMLLNTYTSKIKGGSLITSSLIIGGEYQNITGSTGNSDYSTIINGSYNSIYDSDNGLIIGGDGNSIIENSIQSSSIGSQLSNISNSSINSLVLNTYSGSVDNSTWSGIIGGVNHKITNNFDSIILGGSNHILSSPTFNGNNIIAGGTLHNIIDADESAIIGGRNNALIDGVTNTVIIGGQNITADTANLVYVPDLIIDGLISTDPIATNAIGKIVAGASDVRLKQNINDLDNSLDIIKNLRGVSFEYTPESEMGGGIRYGFIAQEVQNHVPDIVRNRAKGDGMLSLNYNEIVPILVEAVKELASGSTASNNTYLETQTILAEDNNVELNFNGTQQTAIGGGLSILHAKGINKSADLITDSEGNFITNNDFKPNALTIPLFTPTSSSDSAGSEGNITRDDNYLYVKSSNKWKRVKLEEF
jgi:hypothetical protein